jgi:hypothetical protein
MIDYVLILEYLLDFVQDKHFLAIFILKDKICYNT